MKQLILATLLTLTLATPAIAARLIPAAEPVAASAPAPTTTPPAPVAAQPIPARPSAAVAAPTVPARPSSATASHSGFYIGGQVGDSTIGALLGYQLNKMYAMEFSYDYVDPVRTVTTTLDISRVGLSGLALFPIKFSDMGPMAIFIKVGYGRTTEVYTVNEPAVGALPATTTVTTTLKTGVTGGTGVQVDLSQNSTARLGVNYVGGDRSVYLAAMYKF